MNFLISAVIAFSLLAAFIYWLFKPKTKQPLPEFPAQWRRHLEKRVKYYQALSAEDRSSFEYRLQRFLQEVKVTGIGTDVTDYDRVLVAASGIIPTFGFEHWNHYPRLKEVLLYKDTFRHGDFATEGGDRRIAGMVGGGYLSGKLLLSRPALRQGFEYEGRGNTGIHEFVHLLDMADGETNGVPAYFLENSYLIPWLEMMRSAMAAIEADESDIDDYALTNQAEFFSVAAEYFFNRPEAFADNHPELFKLMERIFDQDLDRDGVVG